MDRLEAYKLTRETVAAVRDRIGLNKAGKCLVPEIRTNGNLVLQQGSRPGGRYAFGMFGSDGFEQPIQRRRGNTEQLRPNGGLQRPKVPLIVGQPDRKRRV